MNSARGVLFLFCVFSLFLIGAVALYDSAYGDQTEKVTINTTGDFGDDPAGGPGTYDRELIMKGDGAKEVKVRPESAKVLQGEIGRAEANETDLTISATKSAKVADAMDVKKNKKDVFIRVNGRYVSKGGGNGNVGGGRKTWETNYERGDTRLVVRINEPGEKDNKILPGEHGATLTVILAGVGSGNYTVKLKDSDKGDVKFGKDDKLKEFKFTQSGSKTISLTGVTSGKVTINGDCVVGGKTFNDTDKGEVLGLGVKKVVFAAVKGDIPKVIRDGTKEAYPDDPHWLRGRDEQSPACYVRGSQMKLTVTFTASSDVTGNVTVNGGNADYAFSPKTRTITNGEIVVKDWVVNKKFEESEGVRIFDTMNLKWKCSVGGGKTFDAGISSNQVYVTLGEPKTTVYHTLVHLGCFNAENETGHDKTITEIWGEFTDHEVKNVNKKLLMYYANWEVSHQTTSGLLQHHDGQCMAWAKFFVDIIKVQGINQEKELVPIYHRASNTNNHTAGFLVKKWNKTGNGTSGDPDFPFRNVVEIGKSPIGDTSYNWLHAEVNDAKGIDGQGNKNPRSLFSKHHIVKLMVDKKTNYYDPSYGKAYTDIDEIEAKIIDFYYYKSRGTWQGKPSADYRIGGPESGRIIPGMPTDY